MNPALLIFIVPLGIIGAILAFIVIAGIISAFLGPDEAEEESVKKHAEDHRERPEIIYVQQVPPVFKRREPRTPRSHSYRKGRGSHRDKYRTPPDHFDWY